MSSEGNQWWLKTHFLNPQLSDVNIIVRDPYKKETMLPAHSFVLRSQSTEFMNKLQPNGISNSKKIEIEEMSPVVIYYVLRFLYYGQLYSEISYYNLKTLLEVAGKYKIQRLVDLCKNRLQSEPLVPTVCELLELATLFNVPELRDVCTRLISQEASKILTNDWHFALNPENLATILSKHNVPGKTDEDLEAAIRWSKWHLCQWQFDVDPKNLSDLSTAVMTKEPDKVKVKNMLLDLWERRRESQHAFDWMKNQFLCPTFSDVLIELKNADKLCLFPAHSFVLRNHSPLLFKLLVPKKVDKKETKRLKSNKILVSLSPIQEDTDISVWPVNSAGDSKSDQVNLMCDQKLKLTLHNIDPRIMEYLLKFVYIKVFPDTESPTSIIDLFLLAHKLHFPELKTRCSQWLQTNVIPKPLLCKFYEDLNRLKLIEEETTLHTKCFSEAVKIAGEVLNCDLHLSFSEESLVGFLSNAEVKGKVQEKEVPHAIFRWVKWRGCQTNAYRVNEIYRMVKDVFQKLGLAEELISSELNLTCELN